MQQTPLSIVLSGLSATEAASRLIGSHLIRTLGDRQLIGRIVEAEAYDQTDAASHSYRGITPRTAVMFGPPGVAYVYFTYGMHYCLNVVVGEEGIGAAVLIRALEPLKGIEVMQANRSVSEARRLLSGPARLTQALQINRDLNGHDLSEKPLELILKDPLPASKISWSARIGLSNPISVKLLWRATLIGSPYLSRSE